MNEQPILLVSTSSEDTTLGADTKRILENLINAPADQWKIDDVAHGKQASLTQEGGYTVISLYNDTHQNEETYLLFSIAIYPSTNNVPPAISLDIHAANLHIGRDENIIDSLTKALARLTVIEHDDLDQIPEFAARESDQAPYDRISPTVIYALYPVIPLHHRDNQNPNLWAWYLKDTDEWSIEIYQPAGASIVFEQIVDRKISDCIPRIITLKRSSWTDEQITFSSPSCSLNGAVFDSLATLQSIAAITKLKQRFANPQSDTE